MTYIAIQLLNRPLTCVTPSENLQGFVDGHFCMRQLKSVTEDANFCW